MSYFSNVTLSCMLMFLILSCDQKKTEVVWNQSISLIGSASSLRASDLNEDGVLDLVIGAGKNEFQYSEQGILAFNGKNGELLWQQEAHDQVFGSATFCDITGDGIDDIIIGGRSAALKALNGKNGELIWEYEYHFEDDPILKYAHFNFYNSVLVPDQNNDGIRDLLAVNGGNSKAPANSERDRYPGVLMLFDSKTGGILAADTMPDGKESYMSPAAFVQPADTTINIVFGSGGETIDGHLYLGTLRDLKQRQLSRAEVIAKGSGHGFIAPPAIADINKDGFYDIVAISHGSTAFAIDGKSRGILWKTKVEGTESSNSFAVGQFTNDRVPDFFTFVSRGQWPDSRGSLEIVLNGKNGNIEYMDSIGCTGFSSPVVYDLNHDGLDEAIISINEFDCEGGFVSRKSNTIENKLIAVNFKDRSVTTIDRMIKFKNIFSTPWIGDIDGDGYLDIVYCQYFSPSSNLLAFMGMRVKRISTHIKMKEDVIWGAYMGSDGNGIYSLNDNK